MSRRNCPWTLNYLLLSSEAQIQDGIPFDMRLRHPWENIKSGDITEQLTSFQIENNKY